ncbi:MAG TPA: peptidase M4, partial [Thermoanaerobaculia bacterium]|nr:peptidase M4 [Thermoanaerobaculia bacterium]
MADVSGALAPSTPAASAAVAQSRGAAPEPDEVEADPGVSVRFRIGAGVRRAAGVAPYERKKGEPIYRPLRIYALDAAESRMDGGVALVNVPYEPLEPGPRGALFEVDSKDGELEYQKVDLDRPEILIRSG